MTDSDVESEERAQRAVTERIEHEELARGYVGPDETPATPRPASTIVLARESSNTSFEVLLLKRPSTSRFAAGAFVFPGGKIDPEDAEPRLSARLPRSGTNTEGSAVLAALRELFEETGLLLTNERPEAREEIRVRQELLENNLSFGAILEEHNLSFASREVCYFARWITPAQFSRRYDTRFFLTSLPAERTSFEPTLTDEIDDFVWLTPARAVELFRAGRLPMLFPTRVTLQELAEFDSVADMINAFRFEDIKPLTPRLLIREHSIRPVLPGDPEYDLADG